MKSEDNGKIAYLIMCHKNPDQVNRLISQLHSEKSVCFVHVDKKANFDAMEIEGVHTSRRYDGVLGSYSLVEISDELMITAKEYERKEGIHFKYFCLLSGQDYLLHHVEEINANLEKSYPEAFIDCTPWKRGNWVCSATSNCIWYIELVQKIRAVREPAKTIIRCPFLIANRVLKKHLNAKVELEKRGVKVYGGSAWWVLPDDMVAYLLEEKNNLHRQSKFFPLKYSTVPEESYYQTILMNSEYADRIEVNPPEMVAQNCKTYANFSPPGKNFTGHPYVLTMEDKDRLLELAETRFFARKFDTQVDSKILDWIDDNLLGAE